MIRPLLAAFAALAICLAPGLAHAERQVGGEINLNTASMEQLQMLPGVGPSRARAIMAERMKRPFRKAWEITRVRGIGRAFFKKLEKHLRVDGETTLTVSRGPAARRGEASARPPAVDPVARETRPPGKRTDSPAVQNRGR